MRIEHIGIAVEFLEDSKALFERILGEAAYKDELVQEQGVLTSFFKLGESKVELLAATHENSPIAKFLENRGEGVHHIAFAVDDIVATMAEMKEKGFRLLSEEAQMGADNKLICFLHPKDTNGVLIEFCQDLPRDSVSG